MEAFGVAANIISIIHITTEVVKRLNDFRSTIEGLPPALKSLSVELPTLIHTLKRIRQAIDDGRVDEDNQEALEPHGQGLRPADTGFVRHNLEDASESRLECGSKSQGSHKFSIRQRSEAYRSCNERLRRDFDA
jgi:hypothetical protein